MNILNTNDILKKIYNKKQQIFVYNNGVIEFKHKYCHENIFKNKCSTNCHKCYLNNVNGTISIQTCTTEYMSDELEIID